MAKTRTLGAVTRRALIAATAVVPLRVPESSSTVAADLAELCDRWEWCLAQCSGCLEEAMEAAEADLMDATHTLIAHPSTAPAALAIKLAALIRLAPIICGEAGSFPWPQLRALLAGLSDPDA
jgi:hypothetical protein